MASIDKIYGSNEQYDEFYSWAEQNNRKILRYFYERNGFTNSDDRPISNFPLEVDEWLLDRCPIPWVIDRIKQQYGLR